MIDLCQWLNVLPAAGVQKSENTLKIWASNSDLNLEANKDLKYLTFLYYLNINLLGNID